MRLTFLLFFLLVLAGSAAAQRVLLFEKLTDSRSERLYEGEMLRFKMKGDNFWQEGPIRQMRPDIQALVINDRFIMTDEIAVIDQGNTVFAAAGYGLMTFGAGWSFWALAGNATDGDPTTRYENRDLMVTLTSVGTGYLLTRLLGKKRFKTGKYKRLRVVDTSF
ncbi:hypothetical protein [Lewinella sp. W8]|uniref:hypothetical protein n=1 Tax=Lewinella sp. W8 TaxID=2528208 RepID=UPI001067FA13|nr:hypothetical protein [Lewinella sp. W8]MTB50535.1 hypothetical protein [Lewinella sp. W8]